jgi:hypothetical protein
MTQMVLCSVLLMDVVTLIDLAAGEAIRHTYDDLLDESSVCSEAASLPLYMVEVERKRADWVVGLCFKRVLVADASPCPDKTSHSTPPILIYKAS